MHVRIRTTILQKHKTTGLVGCRATAAGWELRRAQVGSAHRGTDMTTSNPRYDDIGGGYARTRQEDPRVRDSILGALGMARTIVNVGAGAGSYEPRDRYVLAVEPSDVMAAQRPRELAPAIRATADCLPLRDGS